MLWGHTLRSPHAHARIRSIDLSEALTMPGVHAVLTHADVPGAKTTGSSSPTSRCSRSTASSTTASRSRSSPPSIRSRRAAPPSEIVVDYEPLAPVADTERATESELHPERPTQRPRLPRGRPAERRAAHA